MSSPAPVKVFGSAAFTNVARVLVCLVEVGAQYEVVDVDFHSKEHKGADHLARNPFGQVPAFQDGDLMLFQSRAICRYVLRKYKMPGSGSAAAADLLGLGDDLERSAAIDAWLDVEALQYEPPVHALFVQHRVVPVLGGQPDQRVIVESMDKLRGVLALYEARLATTNGYLAGGAVTLADLSHFPYTHYLMAMPYASAFDAFPRVRAWWEDLVARPAVRKVAAMMADPSHP